jgi:nucleoside-diphosphate-sugar epimerase
VVLFLRASPAKTTPHSPLYGGDTQKAITGLHDMRILVTGATGFIGNHVVRELIRQDHQVIATSRNPEKARRCDWFSQVRYVPFDLNDIEENLFQFFQEPDMVIHLAWEGLPDYQNLHHFERYLNLNYRFLKNLIVCGAKNLTVTGTCLEYGLQNGCLAEDAPTQPVTPYGLAKDSLRKFLEQLQQETFFSYKWLRLFYVYGEGQRSSSLLSQLETALHEGKTQFPMSEGEQLRDFLPVQKVAEYIVKVAFQDTVLGIINCCSGTPISVRKFAENYLAEQHKVINLNLGYYPYLDYEPMAFWGCNDRLQKAIGRDSL